MNPLRNPERPNPPPPRPAPAPGGGGGPIITPVFHRDRDGRYFFDGIYQVGSTWIGQLEYEKYFLGSP